MALLLVGFGLKDSIFDIGFLQYHELQIYDGNIILNEDASRKEKTQAYEALTEDTRVEKTELIPVGSGIAMFKHIFRLDIVGKVTFTQFFFVSFSLLVSTLM